jgi:hypothetical protein
LKQERLYILVYIDNDKILVRNLKHIDNYTPDKNDLFIFIRDEFFFGEKGILEISDYFDIPNLEDVMDEKLKKIFFTPYVIPVFYDDFLVTTQNNDLYHQIKDLYEFYIDLSKEVSLENFLKSYNNSQFREKLV